MMSIKYKNLAVLMDAHKVIIPNYSIEIEMLIRRKLTYAIDDTTSFLTIEVSNSLDNLYEKSQKPDLFKSAQNRG